MRMNNEDGSEDEDKTLRAEFAGYHDKAGNQEQRKPWTPKKQRFNRIRRLILLLNQFCLEPMSRFSGQYPLRWLRM